MSPDTLHPTFRKDYRQPDFRIDTVDLDFFLGEDVTVVTATTRVRRNDSVNDGSAPLVLHGEGLVLRSVSVDDRELDSKEYEVTKQGLTIPDVPDELTLRTVVEIEPQNNTALSGLYKSSGIFCTQCEAEGFRRITYFLDRPDVMVKYTTRIEADRGTYPVLLSNGNRVDGGKLDGGRHWVKWEDPFRKPSYLFALVAGDLRSLDGKFVTMSGRTVRLEVWVEPQNIGSCEHALRSMQKAMKWDEDVYGLEYDLDTYMIVAVGDFNMGAMENKGLNIFNSKYVLARPDTATDDDYEDIEGVIGHEYFHNWTGNRVTCRDWFQLTLKEGLTVFRDTLYSSDMTSLAVKRIGDVRILRAYQFPEDAGPMAHRIRPESYIAMDNFYTTTVYDKGAEVIGMYRALLGVDGFRKGMDLYFERHDGQAVTCDDFRAAMADANGADLDQFERWYSQAGTPEIVASGSWDAESSSYHLQLSQSCPPTPGQTLKEPFHIPLACGLLGADGQDLCGTRVLELKQASQEFVFDDIHEEPVPSLLRNFSAPVKLRFDLTDDQLAFLAAHDSDPFNRWEASQKLYQQVLLGMVAAIREGETPSLDSAVVDVFAETIAAEGVDRSLQAFALTLPGERVLGQEMAIVHPAALHRARRLAIRELASQLETQLTALYHRLAPTGPYEHSPLEAGRRRLRNLCLGYLSSLETAETTALCQAQYDTADNMTDELSALNCLASIPGPAREGALASFYDRWKGVALVVDKWLSVQSLADLTDTPERVDALLAHEAFDIRNPNKVRALVRTFAFNQAAFHRADGFGYRWMADRIEELDRLNPQMAARMADAFTQLRRFDLDRQFLMKEQAERLVSRAGISKALFEIVTKTLGE